MTLLLAHAGGTYKVLEYFSLVSFRAHLSSNKTTYSLLQQGHRYSEYTTNDQVYEHGCA